MFARRLAHGETISAITTGTKCTHKTAIYHRWMVWRHLNPEMGKRFRRLSIENKFARVRAANQAKREIILATWVTSPPPDNMWAIIDDAVPRNLLSEVRMEICQRLALDVMERRCECTAAGLSNALERHRRQYYKDYANKWGDESLDAPMFEDGTTTRGDTISRGLWD